MSLLLDTHSMLNDYTPFLHKTYLSRPLSRAKTCFLRPIFVLLILHSRNLVVRYLEIWRLRIQIIQVLNFKQIDWSILKRESTFFKSDPRQVKFQQQQTVENDTRIIIILVVKTKLVFITSFVISYHIHHHCSYNCSLNLLLGKKRYKS